MPRHVPNPEDVQRERERFAKQEAARKTLQKREDTPGGLIAQCTSNINMLKGAISRAQQKLQAATAQLETATTPEEIAAANDAITAATAAINNLEAQFAAAGAESRRLTREYNDLNAGYAAIKDIT